jgi:AraC-like DNA-binding protein
MVRRDGSISVRLMWPFLRAIESSPSPSTVTILAGAGIDAAALGRPETRVPHRAAVEALRAWIARTGDEEIGFRAAAAGEALDLEAIAQAARACATFREALEHTARYLHLAHGAGELSLVEQGDAVLVRFCVVDGAPPLRALNDFIVVSAARFAVRCLRSAEPAREVHLVHPAPASREIYALFAPARLRFGMPHNGFVLAREVLDRPLPGANAKLHALFEGYTREVAARTTGGLQARVRDEIRTRLAGGGPTMRSVAEALSMSAPTLRRRLLEKGTTFSLLLDEVRRDLAEQHLRDRQRTVTELASLLGFAHVPTFHRAFRRWTGITPAQHRKRHVQG